MCRPSLQYTEQTEESSFRQVSTLFPAVAGSTGESPAAVAGNKHSLTLKMSVKCVTCSDTWL